MPNFIGFPFLQKYPLSSKATILNHYSIFQSYIIKFFNIILYSSTYTNMTNAPSFFFFLLVAPFLGKKISSISSFRVVFSSARLSSTQLSSPQLDWVLFLLLLYKLSLFSRFLALIHNSVQLNSTQLSLFCLTNSSFFQDFDI